MIDPHTSEPSVLTAYLLTYYTPRELARACDVSLRTVYYWQAGDYDNGTKRRTQGLTNLRRVAAMVAGASFPDTVPPAGRYRPRLPRIAA